ncbi:MAG: hypothetical protein NYU90_01195 [Aigarchaeota archaeon]|nr:hypothetical protein [Candidatus Calditenuis fumarioli]
MAPNASLDWASKRSRYERVLIRNLREALEGRFNFAVKHSRVVTYVEDLGVAREVTRNIVDAGPRQQDG